MPTDTAVGDPTAGIAAGIVVALVFVIIIIMVIVVIVLVLRQRRIGSTDVQNNKTKLVFLLRL